MTAKGDKGDSVLAVHLRTGALQLYKWMGICVVKVLKEG